MGSWSCSKRVFPPRTKPCHPPFISFICADTLPVEAKPAWHKQAIELEDEDEEEEEVVVSEEPT